MGVNNCFLFVAAMQESGVFKKSNQESTLCTISIRKLYSNLVTMKTTVVCTTQRGSKNGFLQSTVFSRLCYLWILAISTHEVSAQFNTYGNAFKNMGTEDCYTVTPNSTAQGGAVYNLTPVDLSSSFQIRFFVNLGTNDGGADGMTFLFRSNPTVIPVGDVGGSLCITNNNDSTLFVELDTWANGNNNDVAFDHISIMTHDVVHNAFNELTTPVTALPTSTNIEDGLDHELSISWDATAKELKVYFDCHLRASIKKDIVTTIFNGNPLVYYGVTAATGGATNLQRACFSPGIHLPDTIYATCGDTLLRMLLPSNDINCSSIDLDGSDFRVADSSHFNGNPYSVNFLGIKGAKALNCNNINKTDRVEIKLLHPLHYGDYTLIIKKGNSLGTLSPFCSHPDLEDYDNLNIPEFTSIPVKVRGGIAVQIDDETHKVANPTTVVVCLPELDPFPLLKAKSGKAINYYWMDNSGDTIQRIDSIWAIEAGEYTVSALGPFGCRGTDKVKVYFPTRPTIVLDLPPYCDTVLGGDTNNLPALLTVPSSPKGGQWRWEYDFGPPAGFDLLQYGDSLLSPFSGRYQLIYTDTAAISSADGCETTYEFELNRTSHPPEAPLNVQLSGKLLLCSDEDQSNKLEVVDSLLKPNFKAKPEYGPNTPYAYQWFYNLLHLPMATDADLTATTAGFYSVLVKDQYGCVGADTVELKSVDRYPVFEVLCEVFTNGGGRFYWSPIPSALGYEVSFDNGFNWREVGGNEVEVSNINRIDQLQVRAIFDVPCTRSEISNFSPCASILLVPNVVTPNNDGLNDVFFIESLDFYPGSQLSIFDRWGLLVYESVDYKNDWQADGLVEGTYFYLLTVNDGQKTPYKGVFTLLR
jgi:gliding motility-associated-like protein